MPMEAQTRLLRVLQSGEFTTVGGARTIRADVRIVAATNRICGAADRGRAVPRGSVLPPQRRADRAARRCASGGRTSRCSRAISSTARPRTGLPRKPLGADAVAALEAHDWPGNVRELENLMRRLAALARDEVIDADGDPRRCWARRAACSPADARRRHRGRGARAARADRDRANRAALDDGTLYDRIIGEVERPLIEAMLARHGQQSAPRRPRAGDQSQHAAQAARHAGHRRRRADDRMMPSSDWLRTIMCVFHATHAVVSRQR